MPAAADERREAPRSLTPLRTPTLQPTTPYDSCSCDEYFGSVCQFDADARVGNCTGAESTICSCTTCDPTGARIAACALPPAPQAGPTHALIVAIAASSGIGLLLLVAFTASVLVCIMVKTAGSRQRRSSARLDKLDVGRGVNASDGSLSLHYALLLDPAPDRRAGNGGGAHPKTLSSELTALRNELLYDAQRSPDPPSAYVGAAVPCASPTSSVKEQHLEVSSPASVCTSVCAIDPAKSACASSSPSRSVRVLAVVQAKTPLAASALAAPAEAPAEAPAGVSTELLAGAPAESPPAGEAAPLAAVAPLAAAASPAAAAAAAAAAAPAKKGKKWRPPMLTTLVDDNERDEGASSGGFHFITTPDVASRVREMARREAARGQCERKLGTVRYRESHSGNMDIALVADDGRSILAHHTGRLTAPPMSSVVTWMLSVDERSRSQIAEVVEEDSVD